MRSGTFVIPAQRMLWHSACGVAGHDWLVGEALTAAALAFSPTTLGRARASSS